MLVLLSEPALIAAPALPFACPFVCPFTDASADWPALTPAAFVPTLTACEAFRLALAAAFVALLAAFVALTAAEFAAFVAAFVAFAAAFVAFLTALLTAAVFTRVAALALVALPTPRTACPKATEVIIRLNVKMERFLIVFIIEKFLITVKRK